MYLFRLFISLLVFSASLAIIEDDTEYRLKLKNLFKRSHKSLMKHDTLSSILDENLDKTNKTSDLLEYVDYVKNRGVHVLKNMDALIMKEMELKTKIVNINALIHNYTKMVQRYFDKTVTDNQEMVYSEDIIMLDVAEMACRFLYHSQIRILNETLDAFNTPNRGTSKKPFSFVKTVFKHIVETIKQNSTYFKSKEMQYICLEYRVCRQYPAFTDHCGHFLTEILRLPKNKLLILLKVVSMVVSHNQDFVTMVTSIKKDKDVVQDVLKAIAKAEQITTFMNGLKEALTQKFEIIHNPKHTDKIKAAALRMLLDMIDKLYEKENDKAILLQLDTTASSIKKWAKNEISSISVVTANFIGELFKLLNKIIHSNKDSIETIYNLIEILVGDNTIIHEDYYKAILAQRQEL